MGFLSSAYDRIQQKLKPYQCTLVAVSKTKPVEDIKAAYEHGHRDFGENYVQELVDKFPALPKDIRWHFIGHLQSNKVKYMAPFVHLIHGVDSEKLLLEIDKQGKKIDRVLDCLLQVHIAREQTKFGFDEKELMLLLENLQATGLSHVNIKGLMGMATFTEDNDLIRAEFANLKKIFDSTANLAIPGYHASILSMGMSADFDFALENGSNMVRIGSLLFGERDYAKP